MLNALTVSASIGNCNTSGYLTFPNLVGAGTSYILSTSGLSSHTTITYPGLSNLEELNIFHMFHYIFAMDDERENMPYHIRSEMEDIIEDERDRIENLRVIAAEKKKSKREKIFRWIQLTSLILSIITNLLVLAFIVG